MMQEYPQCERVDYYREYMRERYRQHKAQGICTKCGRKKAEVGAKCAECYAAVRVEQKWRQEYFVKHHLCYDCKAKLEEDDPHLRCPDCRAKSSKRYYRRKAQREQGI